MKARYLPLLALGILPATTSPPVAASTDRLAGAGMVSLPGSSGSERCTELRETEVSLAGYEVQLLQQLERSAALAWEKDAWRKELEYTHDSLDEIDRLLAENDCPAR